MNRDGEKIIWTADAIAARIGVSVDFVRDTLAHAEGTPVKRIGRRYAAIERELIEFFSSRPSAAETMRKE